jgi:membrane protein implicated in regulation of membrane protease activity
MEPWLAWIFIGGILVLFELVVPGGITIFLGLASLIVGILIKTEILKESSHIALTFILLNLLFLLFLRTLFLKYFEGHSLKQNVDEDRDAVGSIVQVVEEIRPYKEGRIYFRGTGWQARSDEEILKNEDAIIIRRDGNTWIVKSIKEKI